MATDIVLKDRNGKDVVYEGIETVTFDTPDEDVQATFTLGVEQTGKVVELALADGDQVVQADDGHILKVLTIKKPEDLKPENITAGRTIGAVEGKNKAGTFDSSDETLKFFTYQIDFENKKIILYSILYAVLYKVTESYDVNIPDQIGGYDVVIACT